MHTRLEPRSPSIRAALVIHFTLCMLLASCTKKPDDEGYYALSGQVEAGIDIYANGNPTDGGQKLSLFIVQGENDIDLRGQFEDRGFTLTVLKTKNFFSSDGKTIATVERGLEEATRNSRFSFQEPFWWHWAWQDADLLDSELADEDKEQILAIVDNVCDKIKNQQLDATLWVKEPHIGWWGNDSRLISKIVEAESVVFRKNPVSDDLVFSRASPEKIEFLVGSQIVMLRESHGALLCSLGPESPAAPTPEPKGMRWIFSYGMKVMFFCRFEGEWSLLLPVI